MGIERNSKGKYLLLKKLLLIAVNRLYSMENLNQH